MALSTRILVFFVSIVAIAGIYQYLRTHNVTAPTQPINNQPSYTSTTTPVVATSSANIRVFTPSPYASVPTPIIVTGEARVFENVVSWRLEDTLGIKVAAGTGYASSTDVGLFGPFSITIPYPKTIGSYGTIIVFQSSARDGSEIDAVRIPVYFESSTL